MHACSVVTFSRHSLAGRDKRMRHLAFLQYNRAAAGHAGCTCEPRGVSNPCSLARLQCR